jgi:ubiquinone/menaquinone biosynthesis C-methylase UbiE
MSAEKRGPLPEYAQELDAFHRAFAPELKAVVQALPMSPHMRVLDVACGDGYYASLLASRVTRPGCVTGLDVSADYLALARERWGGDSAAGPLQFQQGELSDLPANCRDNDLVWCAQSLYSLPEPTAAVRQMAAALKPGGILAILENDTLHQLLLPWPSRLEIALRAAEYASFAQETDRPSRYYVGRRLPTVIAEAGLEPLGFRTQCIDRQAPLDADLRTFLQCHLERFAERVSPRLDRRSAEELASLIDPRSERNLLQQRYFTMSWLNVLALGRRP